MKKQLQSIEQDIEFGDLKLSASKCKELFDVGRQAQQTRFIKTLCNYLIQIDFIATVYLITLRPIIISGLIMS